MKRLIEIHYRENGIEKMKTVNHDESLLSAFDDLEKRNAVVFKVDPKWSCWY